MHGFRGVSRGLTRRGSDDVTRCQSLAFTRFSRFLPTPPDKIRRPMLYPGELRAQVVLYQLLTMLAHVKKRLLADLFSDLGDSREGIVEL